MGTESIAVQDITSERSSVFDVDAYEAVATALGPEGMTDVLARFTAEIETKFGAFDRPAAELSAAAHQLLNSAGMMGFSGFAGACRRYHDAVRQGGDLSRARDDLADMRVQTLGLLGRLMARR